MKCPRCNANLVDDAYFCGVCGAPLALPQNNATQTMPTAVVPENNEATLVTDRPDLPLVRSIQEVRTQPFSPQPPAYAAPVQPGPFSSAQNAPAWQQPPQAGAASPTPPLGAYAPGMTPGVMSSAGSLAYPVKRKKRRHILRGFLLTLLLLLIVLAGAWFFFVRPYVHNLVQTRLDQALNGAENQIILFQAALPPRGEIPGGEIVPVSENTINTYLGAHNVSPLQNLHATITPTGLRFDFSAYGFANDIIVVPIAEGGGLQVSHVQVQGVLGLVMSSDELTTELNENFQNFGHQMSRKIQAITLHEHEMDVQVQ